MNALGFHVWMIRFWAFMFSGLLTAIAGILFVYYTEFISPQALALTASAEGPADGDLRRSRNAARTGRRRGAGRNREECRQRLYHRWNFMLGAIFVAIVVFMPEGLVPGAVRLTRSAWRAANRQKAAAVTAGPQQ